MTRQWLWLAGLLVVACAPGDSLPFCSAGQLAVPTPDASCRESADGVEVEATLAESLEPVAGGTRIHVLFGPDVRVAAACAGTERPPTSWRDRRQAAAAMERLHALPPGPPCLAGRRLELNRIGARLVEIDESIALCARKVAIAQAQSTGSQRVFEREFRDCIRRQERAHGELWVFRSGEPGALPFVPTREEVDRRAAIEACADLDSEIGRSSFTTRLGAAHYHDELLDCMSEQGYEPYR